MRTNVIIQAILVFLLMQCSTGFPQQGDDYRFEHITTKDGLPSNHVFFVFKDSRGFMWFSTSKGLCRYDGYEFRIYQKDPYDSTSISGNYLQSNIIEDKNGDLWIGTVGDGLNKFDISKEAFTNYVHDPKIQVAWVIIGFI